MPDDIEACPQCGGKLQIKLENKKSSVLMARQRSPLDPGGGYFGERPEEYGVSGVGDVYKDITKNVKIRTCPGCGYKDEIDLGPSGRIG